MNKREQRRQIEKDLTANVVSTEVWQKKPYTAVKMETHYSCSAEITYVEYGFTKVCWPDAWDAEYGVEPAVRKAIADVSRRIMDGRKTE